MTSHRPVEWQAWVEENYPGRWGKLMLKALSYERVDWKARFEELNHAAQ